mmetsp:Transcript_6429/g.23838  ORF Transcript_6429/g.23838 Transcript_6429/m.23838 type:complete len:214 (+) Transcript_6429:749-1390(+)
MLVSVFYFVLLLSMLLAVAMLVSFITVSMIVVAVTMSMIVVSVTVSMTMLVFPISMAMAMTMSMSMSMRFFILFRDEVFVHFHHAREVESLDLEHLVKIHCRLLCLDDVAILIHGANALLDARLVLVSDQITLVQQDPVCEGHLLNGLINDPLFLLFIEMQLDVLRVNKGQNRIDFHMLLQKLVSEEGLGNWSRISKSGGLDEHSVELLFPTD